MVENDNNIEKEKKNRRKTEKLIFILGFTMIIFVVATYAWFIGLSVAKVNTFEVKIQASEGLSLSLDGENFVDEINLGNTESDVLNNILKAYDGTTSSWLGVTQSEWTAEGDNNEVLEAKQTTELIPVSVKGEMKVADNTTVTDDRDASSTLNLFSKTSMTSSGGGYALRADQYVNYKSVGSDDSATNVADEQPGYVVFNLFIKNKVNTVYKKNFDSNSDEAIYLTRDSQVVLDQSSEADTSSGGDGLENSLRIAFMQIGRVSASSDKDTVTSITCTSNDTVTGLCNAYTEITTDDVEGGTGIVKKHDNVLSNNITYAIWEPNDTQHTDASKAHFTRICKKRSVCTAGEGVTCPTSGLVYGSESCDPIDGYTATYPVSKRIIADDYVDIYDGLNGYDAHSNSTTTPLTTVGYYTDTENQKGDTRKQFFSLAPNSITLVKVYIYLEGQDVDNYDISSTGKAFKINFGFTKDRYEDDHVDPGELPHNGEATNNVVDNGITP